MSKFSIENEFQVCYKVEKPDNGRRFVMTDIHGHYNTFLSLLSKISFGKQDQLFLLGDYIDRGKRVPELLDKIIALITEGYTVFPLRGNHEDTCLKRHYKSINPTEQFLPGYKWGKDIIDEERKIFPAYLNFLRKLPYYYELDNFILVHAGFEFTNEKLNTNYMNMIWGHTDPSDNESNKIVVHGHVKRTLSQIQTDVKTKAKVIGIDNSVYTTNNDEYGNLVCLDLDSFEIFIQPDID